MCKAFRSDVDVREDDEARQMLLNLDSQELKDRLIATNPLLADNETHKLPFMCKWVHRYFTVEKAEKVGTYYH